MRLYYPFLNVKSKHQTMNDDLHSLNVLYIEMIRMLPYEVLIREFRLSTEIIRTIKDLHVYNL